MQVMSRVSGHQVRLVIENKPFQFLTVPRLAAMPQISLSILECSRLFIVCGSMIALRYRFSKTTMSRANAFEQFFVDMQPSLFFLVCVFSG